MLSSVESGCKSTTIFRLGKTFFTTKDQNQPLLSIYQCFVTETFFTILSVSENITDNIRPHTERFLTCCGAVVVHIGILPSVTQITLPGEEAYQPSFPDEAEPLGRLVVMFMYLGQSVGEIIFLVINRVRKGQFDEVEFWKDTFHLGDDEFP